MRLFDYDRAARLMAAADIDVIVAHKKTSVEYLGDYEWIHHLNHENFLTEDGRDYVVSFVGLPREEGRGPFYVCPSTETGYPEHADLWISDVRYWGPMFFVVGRERQMDLAHDPIERLAQVLREKGLGRARIGLEWRHLELVYYEGLRAALPEATLVDAEPVLWQLRMRKSAEEIARLRRAAAATSEVMDLAYTTAHEGMTEHEMDAGLDVAFPQRGLRHELTDIAFGPKGADFVGPTATRLERGHVVRLDIGGSYRGYWCDTSRSLAWGGQPSAEARRAHATILRANEQLREAVRPGARPSDLYRLCMRVIEDGGYRSLTPQAGHSLGRMVHEPPFLTPAWDQPLEPSMIVVVEPTIRVRGAGSFNIEDTLLVTEDGAESLSTVPREIDAYL